MDSNLKENEVNPLDDEQAMFDAAQPAPEVINGRAMAAPNAAEAFIAPAAIAPETADQTASAAARASRAAGRKSDANRRAARAGRRRSASAPSASRADDENKEPNEILALRYGTGSPLQLCLPFSASDIEHAYFYRQVCVPGPMVDIKLPSSRRCRTISELLGEEEELDFSRYSLDQDSVNSNQPSTTSADVASGSVANQEVEQAWYGASSSAYGQAQRPSTASGNPSPGAGGAAAGAFISKQLQSGRVDRANVAPAAALEERRPAMHFGPFHSRFAALARALLDIRDGTATSNRDAAQQASVNSNLAWPAQGNHSSGAESAAVAALSGQQLQSNNAVGFANVDQVAARSWMARRDGTKISDEDAARLQSWQQIVDNSVLQTNDGRLQFVINEVQVNNGGQQAEDKQGDEEEEEEQEEEEEAMNAEENDNGEREQVNAVGVGSEAMEAVEVHVQWEGMEEDESEKSSDDGEWMTANSDDHYEEEPNIGDDDAN